MLCSTLRQSLADEGAARRVGQRDLHDAQAEVWDLKAQVTKLQEEQRNALDALRQQEEKAAEEKAAEAQRMETESEEAIDKWIKYYDAQIAELQSKVNEAQQLHGSSGSSSARLEAELASATQQIADLQRVKTEEGAAEQRAAQANNKISQLETLLSASQANTAKSFQAMQEARKEARKEAETMHSQCSRANERCDAFQKQLQDEKQKFQKAVEDMIVQTKEHARQYAQDLERAQSQQGNHHDSGDRGHKRSRGDSSNGRDSKRKA